MSIADVWVRCKAGLGKIPRDVLIIGVLIAASLASFGLGYLAGQDAEQGSTDSLTSLPAPTGTAGEVVASKSGTKYYSVDCAGAARISDDNKVWFASAALAQKEGYTPADNCTGPE